MIHSKWCNIATAARFVNPIISRGLIAAGGGCCRGWEHKLVGGWRGEEGGGGLVGEVV